jgi:hypothetical protein
MIPTAGIIKTRLDGSGIAPEGFTLKIESMLKPSPGVEAVKSSWNVKSTRPAGPLVSLAGYRGRKTSAERHLEPSTKQ